jgi:Protein of unknown function (DUF1549)/Protein of unknown function (DUF1553)
MRRALLLLLVAAAPLLAPATARGASPYDALVESEWKKAHVRPAPPVDDATFLRRVYLDLAGELPPEEVVRAFLDERASDRRARLVDALLGAPRYAEHFTDYWERVLVGRNPRGGPVDDLAFREYLRAAFAADTHWDVMARQLIAATGRNSDGGPKNPVQRARLQKIMDSVEPSPTPEPSLPPLPPLNGAVNYPLRYLQQPEDLTGNYARVFLGVQVQCAQCHDHPSEKWKQDDFRGLAAAFARLRPRPLDEGKMGIRRVILEDGPPRKGPKLAMARELAALPARALDGTALDGDAAGRTARTALAEWTTSRKNVFFARALVNRYWAYFLGRGLVEPIDDFRRANPPSVPALLDRLTSDFVAHDYDLKWLIRAICATRVYQLSAAGRDGRLWADYRLRPLSPEELLAALAGATGLGSTLRRIGGGGLDALPTQLRRLFTFLFDVDEASDNDSFSGTLPQALFALNGTLTNFGSSARPGSSLAEVLALPLSDEQKLTALYLRALSRPPTSKETQRWLAFLTADRKAARHDEEPHPSPPGKRVEADPLERFASRDARFHAAAHDQAWEDVLWTLLNSSEFTFHH